MTGQHTAVFTWPNTEPSTVIVTGSFDNWAAKDHHLTKGEHGFEGNVLVDYGKTYEFKYVVDGNWLTRDDVDKEWDASGNMNNVYKAPAAPAPEPTPAPVPAVLASEAPGPGTSTKAVVAAPLASTPTPTAPEDVPNQTASDVKAEALAEEAPALAAAPTTEPAKGEDIAASAHTITSPPTTTENLTTTASTVADTATEQLTKAGEELAAVAAGAAAAVTAAGVAAVAYLNPTEVSADSKGNSLKDALAPVTGDHVTNFTASDIASESSTNGFTGKPKDFEHVVEPIKEPAVLVKAPVEEKFEEIKKGEVAAVPATLSAYTSGSGAETPKASSDLPASTSAFSPTIPAPSEPAKGEDIAAQAFPAPATPAKNVATAPTTTKAAEESNSVPGSYPTTGTATSTPASSAPNSPAQSHIKNKLKKSEDDLKKRKSGVFGKLGKIFGKDKSEK